MIAPSCTAWSAGDMTGCDGKVGKSCMCSGTRHLHEYATNRDELNVVMLETSL